MVPLELCCAWMGTDVGGRIRAIVFLCVCYVVRLHAWTWEGGNIWHLTYSWRQQDGCEQRWEHGLHQRPSASSCTSLTLSLAFFFTSFSFALLSFIFGIYFCLQLQHSLILNCQHLYICFHVGIFTDKSDNSCENHAYRSIFYLFFCHHYWDFQKF